MASATNPSPIVKTPASHQRGSNQGGIPTARLATVVDRTYTQFDFLRTRSTSFLRQVIDWRVQLLLCDQLA
jgi:hypothetical protein